MAAITYLSTPITIEDAFHSRGRPGGLDSSVLADVWEDKVASVSDHSHCVDSSFLSRYGMYACIVAWAVLRRVLKTTHGDVPNFCSSVLATLKHCIKTVTSARCADRILQIPGD